MLANKLMSALTGGTEDKLYVDDVFSTYLYTGNGSTQTINNGIDLAGKGGMVWHKARGVASTHIITDTARGSGYLIYPSTTGANTFNSTYVVSFKTNGFTENYGYGTAPVVSWTFRRAPKFFDVVTYTGNGVAGRQIPHALGIEPGFITTKSTSTAGDWNTYHRSATGDLQLNTPATQTASRAIITAADLNTFTVNGLANANGVTYVAYLFAHDPSADGIIQCGSYTGNGSATGPIVNLGWEPQYLMIKNASGTGNWQIIDSMRGMTVGSADATLLANQVNAESSVDYISPTATGFQVTSTSSEVNSSGSTYIYMAIRRPNKPPTTGTQVYNAIARTGTGAAATVTGVGFAPDLMFCTARRADTSTATFDRLRGSNMLQTIVSAGEVSLTDSVTSFDNNGISLGTDAAYQRVNKNLVNYINHFFKRAPGVFDVVCYMGNGTNTRALNHALGVPVEFGFIKARSYSERCNQWTVKLSTGTNIGRTTGALNLNTTFGFAGWTTYWSGPSSTSSVFYVNADGNGATENNTNGTSYVAYLFATKAGISKFGSYNGNGSSQTIDCGFTTGARFILIKRVNAAGDWYVWDTTRGIVAANDPHLSLNTSAAEVTTDDSVDPHASGFIVNQVAATDINVSGGQYIFLSVA